MKFASATNFNSKSGAAEGSAVLRTIPGNVFDRAQRRDLLLKLTFQWVQNGQPDLMLAKLSLMT
jgi:hypothetical protein